MQRQLAIDTPQRPPAEAYASTRSRVRLRRPPFEPAAYFVLAIVLAIVLWTRVDDTRGFFLDEWMYVHGGEYMWAHFPGALWGEMPNWTRGPQRLYALVIGVPYHLFGTWTAFRVAHALNVALLVSAIAPAALFARRIIRSPGLRVLAVALAVVLPWLTISLHLLTENVAFPAFLWLCYAGLVATDAPTTRNQIGAVIAVVVLTLCRLNLAFAALGPAVAVIVAEILHRRAHRREPRGEWTRAMLRRRWPFVAAVAVAVLVAIKFALGGTAALGSYGGFSLHQVTDGLFGATARSVRQTMLGYVHGLISGVFVVPFALGLGTALAAAFGRLGPGLRSAGIITIVSSGATLLLVAIAGLGSAIEERYGFYAVAPLALLAVAALEHLPRLRRWTVVGALLTLWAVIVGAAAPAADAAGFFLAPGGAFWTRVVDYRLRSWQQHWLGWTLLPSTGWLLIALALLVLVAWVGGVGRRAPGLARGGLVAALGLCLIMQAAALVYDFKQQLYGTVDVAGGMANSGREDWFDGSIPDGASAAIVPGLVSSTALAANTEGLEFWNKDPDHIVYLGWAGVANAALPGVDTLGSTPPGADGLATLATPAPRYMITWRNDPLLQFAGPIVHDPGGDYVLQRTNRPTRAVWTAAGLDADGAIVRGTPVKLTLDRARARGIRAVVVTLAAPAGVPHPARATVRQGKRRVTGAKVPAGATATLRLPVPACAGACAPVHWQLDVRGATVDSTLPVYGPPGPPRPVPAFMPRVQLVH